ncbi:MAG: hypothetical protein C4334_06100 [Pyrinomonas sp.]
MHWAGRRSAFESSSGTFVSEKQAKDREFRQPFLNRQPAGRLADRKALISESCPTWFSALSSRRKQGRREPGRFQRNLRGD